MELKDLQSQRFFQQFVKNLIINEAKRQNKEFLLDLIERSNVKQKGDQMATTEQKRKHSKNHSGYKGTKKPTTGCPICLDMYYKAQGTPTNVPVTVNPKFTYQRMAPHPLLQPAPTPPPAPEKTNTYVYIVLDKSGSMNCIAEKTRQILKKTLDDIKANAQKNNIDVFLSLRQFSYSVDPYDFDTVRSDSLPSYIHFCPAGSTSLFDATGQTINDMKNVDRTTGNKHSYLLIVITDGEENNSTKYNAYSLTSLMQEVQKTDRYTLTFQIPFGHKRKFCQNFGIPEGNVIEWEATERGMEQAYQIQTSSFSNYSSLRSKGVRAVSTYYTTDLSNIKPADLNKLMPINNQVKTLKVTHEADIKPFVEGELKFYRPGSAYYQLTKDEKLQSYKVVLIRDKATKKIYAGDGARSLIGLPPCSSSGGTVRVKVGNHANFDVFVQSSSNNRKLVRGTDLIIWN